MTNLTYSVCDYWRGHDPFTDPLIRALASGMTYTDRIAGADLVIHSLFGTRHLRATGALARFNGEPVEHPFRAAQWRVDWQHDSSPDHLRLPVWAHGLMDGLEGFTLAEPESAPAARRFCNFIFSNHKSPMRNAFFELLDRERGVDALGQAHRNMVHPGLAERAITGAMMTKRAVQSEYRFTIAFENSEHLGYTTEKIMDAWLADTIPIYWGNPAIEMDFAPGSYLSLYEEGSLARLVKRVLQLENDPGLYEQYRAANPLRTGEAAQVVDRYARSVHAFGTMMRADLLRSPGRRQQRTATRVYRASRLRVAKSVRSIRNL
jgi:alpha(1,3/1,4) fucosyltransferase